MATKRNVIQLSFKNEGSDKELYDFLKEKLNAPSYIKEELWSIYKTGASTMRGIQIVTEATSEAKEVAPQSIEDEKTIEVVQDLFRENVERDEIDFSFAD